MRLWRALTTRPAVPVAVLLIVSVGSVAYAQSKLVTALAHAGVLESAFDGLISAMYVTAAAGMATVLGIVKWAASKAGDKATEVLGAISTLQADLGTLKTVTMPDLDRRLSDHVQTSADHFTTAATARRAMLASLATTRADSQTRMATVEGLGRDVQRLQAAVGSLATSVHGSQSQFSRLANAVDTTAIRVEEIATRAGVASGIHDPFAIKGRKPKPYTGPLVDTDRTNKGTQ